MTDQVEGCTNPSTGPILDLPESVEASPVLKKEVSMTQARVGKNPPPIFN